VQEYKRRRVSVDIDDKNRLGVQDADQQSYYQSVQ